MGWFRKRRQFEVLQDGSSTGDEKDAMCNGFCKNPFWRMRLCASDLSSSAAHNRRRWSLMGRGGEEMAVYLLYIARMAGVF